MTTKKEDLMETVVAKLRDWLECAGELKVVLNEYLAARIEVADKVIEKSWSHNRIAWVQKEGPKGTYFLAEKQGSTDFEALVQDLELHGGKMSRNGFFYWKFDSGSVGCKPLKNKEPKKA
ncbi:MAG: hypothetical protein QXI71_02690 [Candidatus Bathyarchaeia archaeon]